MRALHDLVQRSQRRFSAPPLGPLGALLSVDDTRWAGAIEAALKTHFLESWIVDNRADHRLLMVRAAVLRLHISGSADEALPGVLDHWQSRGPPPAHGSRRCLAPALPEPQALQRGMRQH